MRSRIYVIAVIFICLIISCKDEVPQELRTKHLIVINRTGTTIDLDIDGNSKTLKDGCDESVITAKTETFTISAFAELGYELVAIGGNQYKLMRLSDTVSNLVTTDHNLTIVTITLSGSTLNLDFEYN